MFLRVGAVTSEAPGAICPTQCLTMRFQTRSSRKKRRVERCGAIGPTAPTRATILNGLERIDMAKSRQAPPSTPPSLPAALAAQRLRVQLDKGKQLLANRPITS